MCDITGVAVFCILILVGVVSPLYTPCKNQFDSVGTACRYCFPLNTAAFLENVEVVPIFPQFFSIWLSLIHFRDAVLVINYVIRQALRKYEGWNFNSGNYLFTTDTK